MAAELGAAPVFVADAAKAGEVVILAIPTKSVIDLPRAVFANVSSSLVVIDLVMKAFNNLFARSLLEKGVPKGTPARVALPVAGDSLVGRATVLGLVDDLGFDPVDAGDLDNSWRQGRERRRTAGILTSLPSGARLRKRIGAGLPNTAPRRKRQSGGPSQRRPVWPPDWPGSQALTTVVGLNALRRTWPVAVLAGEIRAVAGALEEACAQVSK